MINVLYIAGAGRSGSTLFERILGQVNGAIAIGELRHLWSRDPELVLCGCGRVLAECEFWRTAFGVAGIELNAGHFQAMFDEQSQVDRIRYIPQMAAGARASAEYKHRYASYTAKLKQIYNSIHQQSGCQVIVDSSKDISTLFLLTGMPEVKVRILHLVRDGRAVAYSWTKKKTRTDIVNGTGELHRYSPQYSAFDWMYRNGFTEMLRGRADDYMRLRYDDIVADPYRATMDVAKFMGIESPDLGFIKAYEITFPTESHALNGNPMRHEQEVVRVRIDNSWQREFPSTQKAIVTALTWPFLRRYDYI